MKLFILHYNSQLIVPLLLQYVMSNAPQSRQPTPQLDALELQRQRFNSFQGAPSPQSSKQAMQQLYKQQLDSFLEVKAKQKQFELLRQKEERREFNERAEQGKEADRMKEVSYKNYYNMLMNNQSQHQQAYVSPFAKRENLKQSLINRAIEQERGRYQNVDMEVKRREAEKRSNYKNQLLQQIEDRRRKELSEKEHEVREKQHFTANTHNPNDIQRHERERHKDEVGKYREDLDMILERRNRVQSEKGVSLAAMRPEFHNVLTNPIPYNIQNPYILKEMGGQKNPSSYLATKGSQNLKIM